MPKFKLPEIPDTTHKGIRFPNDLIEEVEERIAGTKHSFSSFVIEATRFALKNMDEFPEKEEKQDD